MFLSGPMSTVQNKGLICYSLKCATEISDSDIILSKKIEDFGRLNTLTLKLTTPLFIKVFVRIFVTIQMKLDIKFHCRLQMIMKFCKIILHIANIH